MTTLGEVAVEGVLSTTVFPDAVETVLELLLTVLEIVEEVTVSVALAVAESNNRTKNTKKILPHFI
tara:strand:- start:459 stop:656 length:198 start_codon:yes stop_codon:yes gene_type:complete